MHVLVEYVLLVSTRKGQLSGQGQHNVNKMMIPQLIINSDTIFKTKFFEGIQSLFLTCIPPSMPHSHPSLGFPCLTECQKVKLGKGHHKKHKTLSFIPCGKIHRVRNERRNYKFVIVSLSIHF